VLCANPGRWSAPQGFNGRSGRIGSVWKVSRFGPSSAARIQEPHENGTGLRKLGVKTSAKRAGPGGHIRPHLHRPACDRLLTFGQSRPCDRRDRCLQRPMGTAEEELRSPIAKSYRAYRPSVSDHTARSGCGDRFLLPRALRPWLRLARTPERHCLRLKGDSSEERS
jgi:hypothetical protein